MAKIQHSGSTLFVNRVECEYVDLNNLCPSITQISIVNTDTKLYTAMIRDETPAEMRPYINPATFTTETRLTTKWNATTIYKGEITTRVVYLPVEPVNADHKDEGT